MARKPPRYETRVPPPLSDGRTIGVCSHCGKQHPPVHDIERSTLDGKCSDPASVFQLIDHAVAHRRFPVLGHAQSSFPLASVPWEFIAPHEAQARRNHDQTLQRLAERGGLSVKEMLAVLIGQHWIAVGGLTIAEANRQLLQHLEAWKEKRNA